MAKRRNQDLVGATAAADESADIGVAPAAGGPKPSAGAVVCFVAERPEGYQYATTPAVITKVLDDSDGLVNLTLFVDDDRGFDRKTSVGFSVEQAPGTWHWPGRV